MSRPPYTLKSAAAFLGVSLRSVRRLVDAHTLRSSRVFKGKLLIPAADVENLVESTCGTFDTPSELSPPTTKTRGRA